MERFHTKQNVQKFNAAVFWEEKNVRQLTPTEVDHVSRAKNVSSLRTCGPAAGAEVAPPKASDEPSHSEHR